MLLCQEAGVLESQGDVVHNVHVQTESSLPPSFTPLSPLPLPSPFLPSSPHVIPLQASPDTPIIVALNIFNERRVSALPIVNSSGTLYQCED